MNSPIVPLPCPFCGKGQIGDATQTWVNHDEKCVLWWMELNPDAPVPTELWNRRPNPETQAVALKDAVPVVVKELRMAAARIGDVGLVNEAVQYGLLAREIDRILGEKK